MTFAIEANDLVKTYRGDVRALDGLSVTVPPAPSSGCSAPTAPASPPPSRSSPPWPAPTPARARVAGHDVLATRTGCAAPSASSRRSSGADPVATGRENLLLQGELYGDHGRELRRRVDELLERFGLTDAAGRQVQDATPAACSAASTWPSA